MTYFPAAALLALVFTLTVAGCATDSSRDARSGVDTFGGFRTTADIERVLGAPQSIESKGEGKELWQYDFDPTLVAKVQGVAYVSIDLARAEGRKKLIIVFDPTNSHIDNSIKTHAFRSPITIPMVRALRDEMPAAELLSLLGPPYLKKKSGRGENWLYEAYTKDFSRCLHLELGIESNRLVGYPILPSYVINESIWLDSTPDDKRESLTILPEKLAPSSSSTLALPSLSARESRP